MTRAIVRSVAVVTLTAVTVNELNNMAICKGKKGEFREMRDTVSLHIEAYLNEIMVESLRDPFLFSIFGVFTDF